MRVRSLLRVLVIVFGVGVGFAVYWNWRPAPGSASAAATSATSAAAEADEAAADDEPEAEVAAMTENIYIVESKNGRDVFAIWAEEQTDYVDGWNTWERVQVLIYGDESEDDDIQITSDRARTTGADGSAFDEVVFVGNVLVTLPSGGAFTTRRINYDAVTGVVANCNRNTLQYAGLEIRADCMHFQTAGEVSSATAAAEELRMWQDLTIRAAAGADSNMPDDLAGRADEMRFQPGGEFVHLEGTPQVNIAGTAIRGDTLVLDVGADADELRGVEATGAARARLGNVAAGEAEAARPQANSGKTLEGNVINVALAPEGGGVELITATGGAAKSANLILRGFGQLDAGDLEVIPGERLVARATGAVTWEPQRRTEGLNGLTAESLRLTVAADELESVEAGGGVTAALAGAGDADREFTGERLVLGWINGVLQRGAWPEGIQLRVDGRALAAGHANLDAETGAWELGGDTRPQIGADEFQFVADTMRLHPDGSLDATGLVEGTIGGAYLTAAAALFGDAEAVQLKSSEAVVGIDASLRLTGRVEIVWQTQSLVAADVLMESEPGRLRATGAVELVAVTGDDGEFVTVSAENLLVEETTSEVRVAGTAELRQGRRRIAARTMAVLVDPSGQWSDVLAEDEVEFEDDRARGSGIGLDYAMTTRDLRLRGDETIPALFVYDGVDPPAEYRSSEELRVSYNGDAIVIESTEDGRATTSVVPRVVQGT
jgi:lipopolysaccharide export system protein LptA